MDKWDLYDKKFQKVTTISENDNIPLDLYHYTVNIWILDEENHVLLLKNKLDLELYYPGFWGSLNGNVISEEEPLETCKRILKDKLGILHIENDIEKVDTVLRDPYQYIYETYILKTAINTNNLELSKEFTKAKLVDKKELENMIENGEIAPVLISRINKYIMPILK